MNIALITAAGNGQRMHQDIPKQFLHVENKPIIIHTLEPFQRNPQIDALIVITLPMWHDFVWAYAKQFGITKLRWVVPGGPSGQESIYNGLKTLETECPPESIVMVHDGNRPLISDDIISDSLSVFKAHGSAVAAIPCTEAVFKSEDGLTAETSIPREKLVRTQTPHTYELKKLLWAHQQATERGIVNTTATCTLMYMLGEIIHFSKGSEKNFKLTTVDDLELFKVCLQTVKDTWLK